MVEHLQGTDPRDHGRDHAADPRDQRRGKTDDEDAQTDAGRARRNDARTGSGVKRVEADETCTDRDERHDEAAPPASECADGDRGEHG